MQHTLRPRSMSTCRDRPINFRDDLSEYSSPSSWGERPGPLSLADHRLTREGLQARRTVGEALMQAQRERDWEHSTELCAKDCRCLSHRAARFCLTPLRRTGAYRPSMLFAWAEVQSIILLPYEDKGPYLMAVSTFRLRDGVSREWLLQAASPRGRARWAMEMITLILRERTSGNMADGGTCGCYGPGRTNGLSLALFMDMVRVACEMAQLQPSPQSMKLLVEVLDKLAENHSSPGLAPGHLEMPHSLVSPHFPVAALRRFGDTVRKAQRDFEEFRHYRDVVRLLHAPPAVDSVVWEKRVLPFLRPADPGLQDIVFRRDVAYPEPIGSALASAVERCRRTLS